MGKALNKKAYERVWKIDYRDNHRVYSPDRYRPLKSAKPGFFLGRPWVWVPRKSMTEAICLLCHSQELWSMHRPALVIPFQAGRQDRHYCPLIRICTRLVFQHQQPMVTLLSPTRFVVWKIARGDSFWNLAAKNRIINTMVMPLPLSLSPSLRSQCW